MSDNSEFRGVELQARVIFPGALRCDLHLIVDNLGNQQRINIIDMYMMLLNRAIVLDCPHLDVPWFRDRASKVFLERGWFTAFMFFCAHS